MDSTISSWRLTSKMSYVNGSIYIKIISFFEAFKSQKDKDKVLGKPLTKNMKLFLHCARSEALSSRCFDTIDW